MAVNRIWQHHFGAGIVRTSANFGERGEPPTHPELLDHLAMRFIESGWSIKAISFGVWPSTDIRGNNHWPELLQGIGPAERLERYCQLLLSANEFVYVD